MSLRLDLSGGIMIYDYLNVGWNGQVFKLDLGINRYYGFDLIGWLRILNSNVSISTDI